MKNVTIKRFPSGIDHVDNDLLTKESFINFFEELAIDIKLDKNISNQLVVKVHHKFSEDFVKFLREWITILMLNDKREETPLTPGSPPGHRYSMGLVINNIEFDNVFPKTTGGVVDERDPGFDKFIFTSTQVGIGEDVDTKSRDFVTNSHYVPRNVFALVVRNVVDPDNVMAAAIKELIEDRPLRIDRLTNSFSVDIETGKVSLEQSYPRFEWVELFGKPIQGIIEHWVDYWKQSHIESQPNKATIDVYFIEPDATYTCVVTAWSVKNMLPWEFKGLDGSRDVHSDRLIDLDPISVSCVMHGVVEKGTRINEEAQKFWNQQTMISPISTNNKEEEK